MSSTDWRLKNQRVDTRDKSFRFLKISKLQEKNIGLPVL